MPAELPYEPEKLWLGKELQFQSLGEGLVSVNGVIGFLNEADMQFLYRKAAAVPASGVILEIGSFMGLSACVMANALIEQKNTTARIVCVDTWQGSDEHQTMDAIRPLIERGQLYERFLSHLRLAGIERMVTPMRMRSAAAAAIYPNDQIDLLFIDGDHSLPGAYADLEVWSPKLKPSAPIIGHDCIPGREVHQALTKWCKEHGREASITGPPCHYMFEIPPRDLAAQGEAGR